MELINKLYLVTISYLNYTHDRTETFDDLGEADAFYQSLIDEQEGKEYRRVAITKLLFGNRTNAAKTSMLASWIRNS